MKTFKKTILYIASAVAMTAGFTSCSDFLQEYSQDLSKVESWTDLDEILLGDGYLPPSNLNDINANIDIIHVMADELEANFDDEAEGSIGNMYLGDMFGFYTWMADTGVDKQRKYVGGDEEYWNDLYKRVNVCNMVLELIDEQPELRPDDAIEKERVKGEAYFLRGEYYFLLVNLYGKPYNPSTADTDLGVPVKLTGSIEDVEFSRVSLNQTYAQIISDLEEAERYLEGKTRKSIYHADRVATNLLQARVYLYMQDWEKAAEYATKVLSAKSDLLDYRTKKPGDDCVYKDSPETIFSMGGYVIASAFADAETMWGSDLAPTYFVSKDMRDLFARNDLRKDLFIGVSEVWGYTDVFRKVNGQRSKYNVNCSVSSTCLFRTPEAYLIYAEAMAYLGKDSEALGKLNTYLKTRMDLDQPLSLSGNALIDFIREERAREFLLEGHRWFDLRRYTVCQPYPWTKTITHYFPYFDSYDGFLYAERYVLEENDAAYTLPIPRSVRNFQVSLGNNQRPDRQATRYTPDNNDDDDDYDDDDDW